MKHFKDIKTLTILLALIILLCSCVSSTQHTIAIPDLSNVDESSAKTLLVNKGLLPVVEYRYSDSVKSGNVISSNPTSGTKVEDSTKVTLFVSLGPSRIESVRSTIEWYNLSSDGKDEWTFENPIIQEGNLYILCRVKFASSFVFNGKGFGTAKLSDNYDKTVPLSLLNGSLEPFPEKKTVNSGDTITFYIEISLKEYESEKPTHIDCEISIIYEDEYRNLKPSFSISW